MPRQTLKYKRALEIIPEFPHQTSDELYIHLTDEGYYWDSNMQRWIYSASQQNDPPSNTIKVRVWFDKNQVQNVTDKLTELMEDEGYRLIEKSALYPCRPPKANDGRIYLIFDRQV